MCPLHHEMKLWICDRRTVAVAQLGVWVTARQLGMIRSSLLFVHCLGGGQRALDNPVKVLLHICGNVSIPNQIN